MFFELEHMIIQDKSMKTSKSVWSPENETESERESERERESRWSRYDTPNCCHSNQRWY
jgi:hypothetical protein